MSEKATISLEDIDQDRASVIRRVLSAVLHCDNVRCVFAQIIDGLPIGRNYDSTTTMREDLEQRLEPSEQAMALSREFCTSDDRLKGLKLNETVSL